MDLYPVSLLERAGWGAWLKALAHQIRELAEVLEEGGVLSGQESLWAVGQDAVFNPKQIDFMLKDTPLRRLTTAEDIGRAVVWFSSPQAARQVTGQLISVSGGYTMP